jgi:hypothetical protein
MTAATNREPTTRQTDLASGAGDACLIEANVNPQTGLATDYLNHFNEAIMLLELLAETPECRADFFAWQPKNYGEHFAASNTKHRDIAIAAYAEADPALRQRLDALADSLNDILLATREVMRQDLSNGTATAIADLAVRWVKPLIVRAGAVINGTGAEPRAAGRHAAPQAAVDVLLAR